jgi:hypothetical protein
MVVSAFAASGLRLPGDKGTSAVAFGVRTRTKSPPLAIKRADAETLVLQAGGRVVGKVTKSLDVIVVGGRSPLYRKGHKGTKLAEVDRLPQWREHPQDRRDRLP